MSDRVDSASPLDIPVGHEYPPCAICGGPNDIGEVCAECSKTNDPFVTELEASGGWMVQAGRDHG